MMSGQPSVSSKPLYRSGRNGHASLLFGIRSKSLSTTPVPDTPGTSGQPSESSTPL